MPACPCDFGFGTIRTGCRTLPHVSVIDGTGWEGHHRRSRPQRSHCLDVPSGTVSLSIRSPFCRPTQSQRNFDLGHLGRKGNRTFRLQTPARNDGDSRRIGAAISDSDCECRSLWQAHRGLSAHAPAVCAARAACTDSSFSADTRRDRRWQRTDRTRTTREQPTHKTPVCRSRLLDDAARTCGQQAVRT